MESKTTRIENWVMATLGTIVIAGGVTCTAARFITDMRNMRKDNVKLEERIACDDKTKLIIREWEKMSKLIGRQEVEYATPRVNFVPQRRYIPTNIGITRICGETRPYIGLENGEFKINYDIYLYYPEKECQQMTYGLQHEMLHVLHDYYGIKDDAEQWVRGYLPRDCE